MKRNKPSYVHLSIVFILLLSACSTNSSTVKQYQNHKIVIAHRGASGYLPEHTLAAKAMAYAQGADFLEQDLIMTKDDQVIVMHDYRLETVTNVKQVFPYRHREDGSYYVVDFTLEELRKLNVVERFKTENGKKTPVFLGRFPIGKSRFGVHTFSEELELIQGLNRSTGKNIGIYPEIKNPAFHLKEGKDISLAVLTILKTYGYTKKTDEIYLQCFDAKELKRINEHLFPTMNIDLKLVQLMKAKEHYKWMQTEQGMKQVASYADGIGPSIHQIIDIKSPSTSLKISTLVDRAHAANLFVHPYTFRNEADKIPKYAQDYNDLVNIFLYKIGVDGIFTDFPDMALGLVNGHKVTK
jgi:glycerophosphoryl diester phosphodiesterase